MISRTIITVALLASVITLALGTFYIADMDHSHTTRSNACALQVFARERCPGVDLLSMAFKHASHHIQTIRSIFSVSSATMLMAMVLASVALMLGFVKRAMLPAGSILRALSHRTISIRYWSRYRFLHWLADETSIF